MTSTTRSLWLRPTLTALISALGLPLSGCKKDEPPPPLPSAQPVEVAAAPLELKPIDAGLVAPVEEAAKGGKGGGRPGGLKACCAGLRQNSTDAPEPTKTYLIQAAAMCDAAAAQGQNAAGVMAMLSGALRGAAMPAACK